MTGGSSLTNHITGRNYENLSGWVPFDTSYDVPDPSDDHEVQPAHKPVPRAPPAKSKP